MPGYAALQTAKEAAATIARVAVNEVAERDPDWLTAVTRSHQRGGLTQLLEAHLPPTTESGVIELLKREIVQKSTLFYAELASVKRQLPLATLEAALQGDADARKFLLTRTGFDFKSTLGAFIDAGAVDYERITRRLWSVHGGRPAYAVCEKRRPCLYLCVSLV